MPTISPANASNRMVNWATSNAAVATVTTNGLVTGVTAGTVTITATTQDGNKTATTQITVLLAAPPPASIWTIADDKDPAWVWSGYDFDACGSCFEGSAHSSDVLNSFATYTFTGTDVEAYCETWYGAGSVDIYIDDVLKGSFSQRIAPYGGATKFATISGLTNGSHTIKFVATSTDWTGIDYIQFKIAAVQPPPAAAWTIADNKDPTWVWSGWISYDEGGSYQGTAHGGDVGGQYGSYTFTGTEVEYYAWNGYDGGNVEVFIDGVSRGIYSLNSATDKYNVKVFQITGLAAGSHIIKIVGVSGLWFTVDYIRFRNSIVLPLRLISFTAKLANGKSNLKWVSDNEINVSHFDVERSSDGNRFEKLTEITSKGGGIYNMVDAAPLKGVNYYRLKMVDKDGKFAYSNIEVVKVLSNAEFGFNMYPNPNKGILILEPSLLNKPVIVSIFDQQGRMVLVKQITGITSINISQLANGVYTVKMIHNTDIKTAKLIKQ